MSIVEVTELREMTRSNSILQFLFILWFIFFILFHVQMYVILLFEFIIILYNKIYNYSILFKMIK